MPTWVNHAMEVFSVHRLIKTVRCRDDHISILLSKLCVASKFRCRASLLFNGIQSTRCDCLTANSRRINGKRKTACSVGLVFPWGVSLRPDNKCVADRSVAGRNAAAFSAEPAEQPKQMTKERNKGDA